MNKILVAILALVLAACQPASETETAETPESTPEAETAEMPEAAPEAAAAVDEERNTLAAVLEAQPTKRRRATNTAIRRKPSSFLALNLA